jgi:NAD(P)-dependent dehydrogenase (short-subunit alcohol dehydrogenase family)
MFNLAGKCAVVIGGTSGIGRAIALGLASAGATVIASSRSKEAVDALADCLEARGSKTLRICSDVLDRASLQDLHDAVLSSFGRIDILINSAGATKRIPTLDCSEELWQSIMNVNLNGTLRTSQIFGQTMLKQQRPPSALSPALSRSNGPRSGSASTPSRPAYSLLTSIVKSSTLHAAKN